MNLDKYPVVAGNSSFVYEFVSEGKKGKVIKFVMYSKTQRENFYNLGFGDKNEITGEIDDKIATDNGDRDKVLATVASTLYLFTDNFPDAVIVATGSTRARTRLYKISISNHLNLIKPDFEIFGLTSENELEPFDCKGEYLVFFVRRKKK
jgi:hypothetical protein